jgi:hypothetical protein
MIVPSVHRLHFVTLPPPPRARFWFNSNVIHVTRNQWLNILTHEPLNYEIGRRYPLSVRFEFLSPKWIFVSRSLKLEKRRLFPPTGKDSRVDTVFKCIFCILYQLRLGTGQKSLFRTATGWPSCSSIVIYYDISSWNQPKFDPGRNTHAQKSKKINLDLVIAGMILKSEPSSTYCITVHDLRSVPLKAMQYLMSAWLKHGRIPLEMHGLVHLWDKNKH